MDEHDKELLTAVAEVKAGLEVVRNHGHEVHLGYQDMDRVRRMTRHWMRIEQEILRGVKRRVADRIDAELDAALEGRTTSDDGTAIEGEVTAFAGGPASEVSLD